jgi:hypothetical protein
MAFNPYYGSLQLTQLQQNSQKLHDDVARLANPYDQRRIFVANAYAGQARDTKR